MPDHGDIVNLACQQTGRLYAAKPGPSGGWRMALTQEVFRDGADPGDAAQEFQLVKQGTWFGFRALAAEGRMLQCRRKASAENRLIFYSALFGINEQWQVADSSPGRAPGMWNMAFRSRQANFRLDVVLHLVPGSLTRAFSHYEAEPRQGKPGQENGGAMLDLSQKLIQGLSLIHI